MQWLSDAWWRRDLPRPVVATIGNYDGVHCGQRAILDRLVGRARALELPAAVITFNPHPLTVVAPERAPRRLASKVQKRRELESAGVDAVVEIRFDREFSRTGAEEFVRKFLHERLDVRAVVVGSQFTFGREKGGQLSLLERLGEELGFEAEGIAEVLHLDAPVSSSRIRQAVLAGDVALAAEMLGRPYAMRGTIVRGQRRGAVLEFPTINLAPRQEVNPARGVYIGEVQFDEGPPLPAVTNVGVRPTISEGGDLVVESHILDFSRDVYGMDAEVSFLQRLRDEKQFESVEALTQQIQLDTERARRYFETRAADG